MYEIIHNTVYFTNRIKMKTPKQYILVCNSLKPKCIGVGCCGEKNSIALIEALKKESRLQGCDAHIEILLSACLHHCAEGTTVKIIPKNIVYGNMQATDVQELIASVVDGEVITRLHIPSQPRSTVFLD